MTGEADSFTFEAIGMDKNSLSNLGFGLYGERGVGIFKYYDILFINSIPLKSNMDIELHGLNLSNIRS